MKALLPNSGVFTLSFDICTLFLSLKCIFLKFFCEIASNMLGDRWHISSTLVVPGNWSHHVGPRKLGSTWRLGRLIKCREDSGDPESLGPESPWRLGLLNKRTLPPKQTNTYKQTNKQSDVGELKLLRLHKLLWGLGLPTSLPNPPFPCSTWQDWVSERP